MRLEIGAKEFSQHGRDFLERVVKNGGVGVVTSRHTKNKFPDRDLILTLVDVDIKEVSFIPIKQLYAGGCKRASEAISKGILYVHNRAMGKTFRMEVRAL